MLKEDRANSVPILAPVRYEQQQDDSSLEGVTAPIKLLLKLIQDHKDACGKGKNDSRRMLRVATMMTILETVGARIQNCQSFGNKNSKTSLRRCNTDLRLNQPPKDKKFGIEAAVDEKEKLRRELSACTAARKRLEMICSSLGKEKEIMAMELSRKAQELSGMEELVNDLKAQNEKLVRKVQECVGGESQGYIALQQQNKSLNELLVRSHNGNQLMKQKLVEAEEENMKVCGIIDEMKEKIESSLSRVKRFKDRAMSEESSLLVDAREDVEALENMFEYFQTMIEKHDKKSVQLVREEEPSTRSIGL